MKLPCPQCGGENRLQETSGFVPCAFCGTSLVLDLTGARPHLFCRVRYGATDTLPLLRRWCDAQRLPPPAKVSPPHLVFYPFWRYAVPGGARLIPAWPVLDPRWEDVTFPEAEQVIFDPAAIGTAQLIEANVAEAAARQRTFGESAASLAPGDLVHVPFYEVQALVGGDPTRISLDACSGRVYSDRVPPVHAVRGDRHDLGLAMTILGFLGMFVEALLIPPAWLAVIVVGLTAPALYWVIVSDARASPR